MVNYASFEPKQNYTGFFRGAFERRFRQNQYRNNNNENNNNKDNLPGKGMGKKSWGAERGDIIEYMLFDALNIKANLCVNYRSYLPDFFCSFARFLRDYRPLSFIPVALSLRTNHPMHTCELISKYKYGFESESKALAVTCDRGH